MDIIHFHFGGKCFGRVECNDISIEEVIPTIAQVNKLEKKIPQLINYCKKQARISCPTIEYLKIYCNYFKTYHAKAKMNENSFCSLPIHHTVVTTTCQVKPCFFIPESISPQKNEDPLCNQRLNMLRQQLYSDTAIRERSCRICMQTTRNFHE